ncbi:dynamin family protein [Lampropedia puyangensis]|uniref:dynamin family protein n=1 Tax=Lampropedia puyangensis TaxID=1330072 RepID=UPI001FCE6085|nr:dynamin family protein [Lampropedia puyangensis]
MSIESQTFNQRFDQYGQWRAEFAKELSVFSAWLEGKGLRNASAMERLSRLHEQTLDDKLTVAFVAEYSRGKSEMINALFFSSYGRRIMPASAGRTTMCPTELTWDATYTPSVRLLPIETRKLGASLADWRLKPSSWLSVPLNAKSGDSVAAAVERVTETISVDVAEARRLGFWVDGADDNPPLNASGLVDVPKWRHAVINFPHPLLKKGMVILDTPGLNAIGAEPELTISLLPQAQAVLFILGADTGVTRSDLRIWQDLLGPHVDSSGMRLVVLNKIDTLWDSLTSKEAHQTQIRKQRQTTAQTLGVPLNQVIAISAQKALVAKITKDDALLRESAIRQLESVLVDTLLGQRHQLLNHALFKGLAELRADAQQILTVRLRDLTEQMQEIAGLQGKNSSARRSIRMRIARERKEFDSSVHKILGLRAAQNKLLNQGFQQLSSKTIKSELASLTAALQGKMLTFGFQKRFFETFDSLKESVEATQEIADQMHRLAIDAFDSLNTEFGFSLTAPQALNLGQYIEDLDKIAQSNKNHFSVANALRFSSNEFSERLVAAISMRLRSVFEAVSNELELWSKASSAQLDVQLKERRHSFLNRSETIERIEQAELDLTERLQELQADIDALASVSEQLQDRTSRLEDSLHSMLSSLDFDLGQPQPVRA